MANKFIPNPHHIMKRAFLKPQTSEMTSFTMYDNGKTMIPAVTTQGPKTISLTDTMLEMSKQEVNKIPKKT